MVCVKATTIFYDGSFMKFVIVFLKTKIMMTMMMMMMAMMIIAMMMMMMMMVMVIIAMMMMMVMLMMIKMMMMMTARHPCGQNSMIPIPACGRYQTTSVWIIQDDDENKNRGGTDWVRQE